MLSNNDQFEEVIAYNDLMTYIEKIMTTRSYGGSRNHHTWRPTNSQSS